MYNFTNNTKNYYNQPTQWLQLFLAHKWYA